MDALYLEWSYEYLQIRDTKISLMRSQGAGCMQQWLRWLVSLRTLILLIIPQLPVEQSDHLKIEQSVGILSVDIVEWWCFFIGCSSCQVRVYLGYTTLMSAHQSHSPNNAVRCIMSQPRNDQYMPNAFDVKSPESLQCSYEHARLRSTSRSRHPPFSARHRFPAQRTFGRA